MPPLDSPEQAPADERAPMKTVLAVDDERLVLQVWKRTLLGIPGVSVLTASDGEEAKALLGQEPVDLVITDLLMPRMSGYELLIHLYERLPSLPVIVISGEMDLERYPMMEQLGALRILPKPVQPESLQRHVRTLLSTPKGGAAHGLGLESFLSLLQMEMRTCTLTVRSWRRMGTLYIREGRLVQAVARRQSGLLAAFEILKWERPDLTFVDACNLEGESLDLPLNELLLDSAFIRDLTDRESS
ncbi:MAG: response regulator [Acidobacteria bacterium]|nr:response regulator [Acidobacteriota bacterium]